MYNLLLHYFDKTLEAQCKHMVLRQVSESVSKQCTSDSLEPTLSMAETCNLKLKKLKERQT